VPNEVTSIFENQVLNLIPKLYPNLKKQFQKSFRLFGLSESHVGTEIDSLELSSEVIVAYRPHFPELLLVFNCENEALLNDAVTKVIQQIGTEYFYSEEKKKNLATTVFELLLKSQSKTVSFAESCSGGLLANAFVDIAGASSVFLGSAVTYSNESKQQILEVTSLVEHGAVSEVTASQMAVGAKKVFCSDYALAITGIAGPDGATEQKPVGTICIALVSPEKCEAFSFKFSWERERNRSYSVAIAIELLRRKLLGLPLVWERK
jgi:nicotinamide-nucleotide amidase